jgi:hypothetical protein
MEFTYELSAKSAAKLLNDNIVGLSKEPVTLHFDTRGYTVTPTLNGELVPHSRIPFEVALSHVLDHIINTSQTLVIDENTTVSGMGYTFYIRTPDETFVSLSKDFVLDDLLARFVK